MSKATATNSTDLTANPSSSLADRIRSYWTTLDEGDGYAAQLHGLSGRPVVTAEDAMATLDWLIHDGHEPLTDCYGSADNPWPSTRLADKESDATSTLRTVITASLLRELFNYIASTGCGREPWS